MPSTPTDSRDGSAFKRRNPNTAQLSQNDIHVTRTGSGIVNFMAQLKQNVIINIEDSMFPDGAMALRIQNVAIGGNHISRNLKSYLGLN
jgi:hypothetical protein